MAEQQYLDLKHLDKQLDEFEKRRKKLRKCVSAINYLRI